MAESFVSTFTLLEHSVNIFFYRNRTLNGKALAHDFITNLIMEKLGFVGKKNFHKMQTQNNNKETYY